MNDEPKHHEAEIHVKQGTAAAGLGGVSDLQPQVSVIRGLNDVRLAVLGILVTIGLGAAALASGWWRILAGVGAFALSCILIRWPWSRRQLMAFIHWLTDL